MSRLPLLMRGLKANTVVIIENALQYETDPELVLGKFSLKKCNRAKICLTLENLGHQACSRLLQSFYASFEQSPRKPDIEGKGAENFFKRYITKDCGITDLGEDAVIDCLRNLIAADENNDVKSTFMKYGIYSIEEADYNQIISEIHQVEESEILFYKSDPPAHGIEAFFLEIDETCEETGSEFCLAIIDKKLGTGGADEEGKVFIADKIIPENNNREKKIICCLYTSAPVDIVPDKFEKYFLQEIGKTDPEKNEKIVKTIARASYAQVFNIIMNRRQLSAENARDLVLRNQKNIKYIIKEALNEGIPGYDAIKYWFDLAEGQQFDTQEIADIKFIGGITNFFKTEFLEDGSQLGEITNELKNLNSFELFDFNVNKKHQPFAPGDIWKTSNGDHFILMGQLCDTLLRTNNTRKAKIGELLKLKIEELQVGAAKFKIKVDDEVKTIIIQNFKLPDGTFKRIEIDVSTPEAEFADLMVLDLCMFNDQGRCYIELNNEPTEDIFNLLPENIKNYHKDLIGFFNGVAPFINSQNQQLLSLVNEIIKFSRTDFVIKESNVIDFNLQRVGRLKGRFYDSVYNNYLNNKGRIDLNLIDNYKEQISIVTLRCMYFGDPESMVEMSNVNLWAKDGIICFLKDDLLKTIPSQFVSILSLCPSILTITNQATEYELTLEDDNSYKLVFKYLFGDKKFIGKDKFSYTLVFNEPKPASNPYFKVNGDETQYTFMDEENKHARNPLSIDQLKLGVTVLEKNMLLQIVNGILIRTGLEK